MQPAGLLLALTSNLIFGVVAWIYFRRFKTTTLKHAQEIEKGERELKRRILELQVLRSLGERAGYSLDLRQILEVITDALSGLVEYSTISYMMGAPEGRIILKTRVTAHVSPSFLSQSENQMLDVFSILVGRGLDADLVDKTLVGEVPDDHLETSVGSYFNLPLVIGKQTVALICVSSLKPGLYADEETALLYTILNQVSSQAGKLSQVVENEKRKLSAMIGSLDDGIMMVDCHLKPLVTNQTLVKLLELNTYEQSSEVNLWKPALDGTLTSSSSYPEVSLFDVVASLGTRVDLEQAIKKSLSDQTLVEIPELEVGEKTLQIAIEPVKDKFNYLLGAVVIFHDVSAQRRLEKLREEFTAMMVHELRTPLTTILYGTDTILSSIGQMKEDELRSHLALISSTCGEMLALVNDLLDVAKIEAGKFQIVKEVNDLRDLIAEETEKFSSLAQEKKLQLISEIDPELKPFPYDKKRIGQALNNLISNALKYTEQGSIRIVVHLNPPVDGKVKEVSVSVVDTGVGIKQEDMGKLFSKFEQLGKGKSGEKNGTGLGLVITKGIIESHGGKIWAESNKEGFGTSFTFTLPIEEY